MTVDSSQDAQPAHASALLAVRGAVPADGLDTGVAAHYGDPLREQRAAERGAALVDRSHRGVLRLTGPDRLSWLHSLTSQHLTALPAMRGSEALLLSPHGHVEHHLLVADDGEATLLDVEPGTVSALLDFLIRMRFMLRVELADVSGELAVLSVIGPEALAAVDAALGTGPRAEAGPYPLVRGGDGVLARAMPYGADLLVPRPTLDEVAGRLQAAARPWPASARSRHVGWWTVGPGSASTPTTARFRTRSAGWRPRSTSTRAVTAAKRRSPACRTWAGRRAAWSCSTSTDRPSRRRRPWPSGLVPSASSAPR